LSCLSERPLAFLSTLALLAIPLIIASLWGAPLEDDAYIAFAAGREIASGRNLGTGRDLIPGTTAGKSASPPFVLLWALLDRLGIPLLPAGVALSGLGWSVTALALVGIGRSIGRPLTAATSAILVVLNPLVASTLGTEISWALALFWIAVWLAVRGDWPALGSVLAWMLWVHFDWMMLTWAIAMLGLQWRQQRRFPRTSALVLAVSASASALMAVVAFGAPLAMPRFSLAGLRDLGQLLAESEWYWLGLPLVGLGLLAVRQKAVWLGLLGGLLVSTGDGAIGGLCLLVASALLAGLGVDWSAKWIETRTLARPVRLLHRTVPVPICLALIALLPLGIAQVSSLRYRYQARPHARYEIERQVGEWLSSHAEPGGTVLGSAQIGYLADRPAVVWNGAARDGAQISLLIETLNASPPEYCVSTNTIAWDWLTWTGWFQERYELLGRYETAYDAQSPLLLWGYRASGFDHGKLRPVSVSLPQGISLVGSQHWPERIEPGDAVYVTLYFQSTQVVSSAIQTRLRLFSPTDGANWANQNSLAPHSMPVDWWQPGQVIAERFVLTTTTETPVGAYPLDLSVTGTQVEGLVLGYVSVPWRGSMEGATGTEATFSDQIRLLGFEAPGAGAIGSEIQVTLYWEAIRPPDDDYIVFVHLVGPTGQPETSHDGVPMNRRYSTLGWRPGDIVPDTHPLPLKPDMPPGTYTLKVGMYRWPSMERLAARDGRGIEQADRAITLSTVEVR
jgi:hypothetical protein